MTDNKTLYIAVGVIAAVAIVAVAAFVLFLDKGEYDKYEGKYFVYDVSGNYGSTTFDGTFKIEITGVKGSTATATYTYDVYQTTSGVRTPLMVKAETETVDLSEGDDVGVWQRTETMSTKWGSKTVDVYLEVYGSDSTEAFVDKDDPNVLYKIIMIESGMTMTFTLSETNFF